MPRTVVARSANEILALRDPWESLYSRCRATVFQSFKWNWIAARVFSYTETPYVIYCETDHGRALLPLCIDRQRKCLAFLGNVLFDYRNALSNGDDEALMSAWKEAAQLGLRFSSGALIAVASDSWSGFQLNLFYGAPQVLASDITVTEFTTKHTRSASRLRRLERMNVTVREYSRPNGAMMRWIYRQKATQPAEAGENVFCDPRRIEFMQMLASVAPGYEEVFTLEADSQCIAVLVTLREQRCRRFYTVWFDQRWSAHSPGIALIYEVTRRSLAEGLDCDYMTGEQSYKMRFATCVEQLYWIEGSIEQMQAVAARRAELAA